MLRTKKVILVSICLLITAIGCSPKAPTRRLDLNADKTKSSEPLQEKPKTAEKPEEAVVYELTPTYVPYSKYNTKKQATEKSETKVAAKAAGKTPLKQTIETEKVYEKPIKKI